MKDYIYDGTFEGLLTAVFYSYKEKDEVKIYKNELYVPNLICAPVEIKTESDKFERVYSSIENKLSSNTLRNVYYLYLCSEPEADSLALEYLKLCYKYGDDINLAMHNKVIADTYKYCRRVTYEAHRFTGFVRFKEINPLTFYSEIEPDHNILPLISRHFTKRFSDQNFIIHDLKRNLALVYNKKSSVIISMTRDDVKDMNSLASMDDFENLWKAFYKATTIEERRNPKLQRRSMPKRYWSHLVEDPM